MLARSTATLSISAWSAPKSYTFAGVTGTPRGRPRVSKKMPRLRPMISMRVDSPVGGGDVGGGLDALGVEEVCGGFEGAAFCLSELASQEAGELVEVAVGHRQFLPSSLPAEVPS